jgi:hypothetical protein
VTEDNRLCGIVQFGTCLAVVKETSEITVAFKLIKKSNDVMRRILELSSGELILSTDNVST